MIRSSSELRRSYFLRFFHKIYLFIYQVNNANHTCRYKMETNPPTNPKNPPMTEEERLKLAEKLDNELDEFISGLERKQYTEGWSEDTWQEEMEKHPFFMTKPPEPGQEVHPLLEGIQKLKYDPEENSAEDLGSSYKEDGNFNFKHKKYRLAVLSYTEGLRQKFDDSELRATLHNNRAAAHYYLKNYRSSFRDCEFALKYKPDYDKPTIRAANCCYEISLFDKCIEYCDKLLLRQPEFEEVVKLRQKAVNARKVKERDERVRKVAERKEKERDEALLEELRNRGIRIDGGLRLELLEPKYPQLAQSRVHLDETGALVWPVVLMFPEYKLTEFVQSYSENDTVSGILGIVFEERPDWDEDGKYDSGSVSVYYEDRRNGRVHEVSVDDTLKDVLGNDTYVVTGGVPQLLILARGSPAEKHFLTHYE